MEDSNEYLTSSDSSSGSGEPQRINRYYLALSEEGNIRQVSENDNGDIYPINLPLKRVTSETYFFGKTPAASCFETELYSFNSDDHNTRLSENESMSKSSEGIQPKPSCPTSSFVKSNEPDKDLEALEVITESDRVENVAAEESLDTTEYDKQIANHLATITKEMEKYEELIADESLQTSEWDKVLEAIHLITESVGVENVVADENHGAGVCNKQTDATHVTTEAMEIDRNEEIRANESHQTSGKDANQKESTGTRKDSEISYNFEDRNGGQTGSKALFVSQPHSQIKSVEINEVSGINIEAAATSCGITFVECLPRNYTASTNQGIQSPIVPHPSNVPEAPESTRQTGFDDSLVSDADSDLDARSPSHLITRATESNGDGNYIPTSMIPEDLANSTYRTVTHRDQGTQTHLEATASNILNECSCKAAGKLSSSPTVSVNESEIMCHNILQYSNGWRQLHTHMYQENADELSYQCSDCAKQEMEMPGRCFHFQLAAKDNIYFCKRCGYIHAPSPKVSVSGSGNVMISENRTPKATQICTENLAKQINSEDNVDQPKEPLILGDNAVNECEHVANVSTADVNSANIHETSILRLDLSVPKHKNSNVEALKRKNTDKARLQLEAECRVVVKRCSNYQIRNQLQTIIESCNSQDVQRNSEVQQSEDSNPESNGVHNDAHVNSPTLSQISKSTENTDAPCTSHQPEDNLALPCTSKSSDPCQKDARLILNRTRIPVKCAITTSIQTKRPRRERLQRIASASVEIPASSQAQYELLPVTSKRNKYKCNSCGFEVTGKRRIEDHIKLHQETYQHASRKCEICGWLILKEGWSLHHIRHHPNNDHNLYRKFQPVGEIGTRYECKHCKYKTTENTKIQCHKTLRTNRIKESTKCKECKIRYHMSSFYLHDCYTKGLVGERLIHIKCNECGALCPNSAELRKHKCLHEKKEGTLCSKPGCEWVVENIKKHNRKWHSRDRVRKWQAKKFKSTFRETCPEDLISHQNENNSNIDFEEVVDEES